MALNGKVVAKPAESDAEWQTALTRAALNVRLPVRSVLAEPVVNLCRHGSTGFGGGPKHRWTGAVA